ncbi:hypothetical protein ACFSCV_14225 [Methylopila henanensis]|uniref:Uncharacterized protein n=1 Tax=Methylopila henanensis TaxID=873516 RepID=A0ABW4KC94_9HYPH
MIRLFVSAARVAALICLIVAAPHAAAARAPVVQAISAAESDKPKEDKSCRQGARTKAFGWMLVDYGVATLKYVVGLFLIPVGLLLVCIGVVVEVVEAVAC